MNCHCINIIITITEHFYLPFSNNPGGKVKFFLFKAFLRTSGVFSSVISVFKGVYHNVGLSSEHQLSGGQSDLLTSGLITGF